MVARELKVGDVRFWLDQGPAVLMAKCEVQDPVTVEDFLKQQTIIVEQGWTISLLQTGEVLDVHEETLHLGEV
jgi:hypothetical protein